MHTDTGIGIRFQQCICEDSWPIEISGSSRSRQAGKTWISRVEARKKQERTRYKQERGRGCQETKRDPQWRERSFEEALRSQRKRRFGRFGNSQEAPDFSGWGFKGRRFACWPRSLSAEGVKEKLFPRAHGTKKRKKRKKIDPGQSTHGPKHPRRWGKRWWRSNEASK